MKFHEMVNKAIVWLANLFLYAYLVDGVISLIDVSLEYGYHVAWLSATRSTVAFAVMILAAVWLFMAIVLTRIPAWRLFFLALSVFWLNTGAEPLGLWFDTDEAAAQQFALTSLQIVIGLLCLLNLRGKSGGWWFTQSCLDSRPWTVRRWLLHWVPQMLVVSTFWVSYIPLLSVFSLEVATGRFVEFKDDGLYIRDVAYRSGETTVRLVGMVHVGQEVEYLKIFDSFDDTDTIILTEGVTDERRLLGPRTSRTGGEIVRLGYGLIYQPSIGHLLQSSSATVRQADADVSVFSEETLEIVRRLSGMVADRNLMLFLIELDEDYPEIVERELIDVRNQVLLSHLDEAVGDFRQIIVPWGVLHLPKLAQALEDRGFHREWQRQHRLVSWRRLLFPIPQANRNRRLEITYTDDELEAMARQLTSRARLARKPGVVMSPVNGERASHTQGPHYGGLPTRFEGESWPINPETGRPLTFVFELPRNETNKDFMGDIQLIRVFVDYEEFLDGNDTDGKFEMLVTTSKGKESTWEREMLEQLQDQFGQPQYGPPMIAERVALESAVRVITDKERDDFWLPHGSQESRRRWIDIHVREDERLRQQEGYLDAWGKTVLGGHPAWQQGSEDYHRFPFFLQLQPDGELTFGDAGSFYIFLDKDNPGSGFSVSVQMG